MITLWCFWASRSRVVHRCPSRPTNWREFWQIGHSSGGSGEAGNCAPQVKQIKAVLIQKKVNLIGAPGRVLPPFAMLAAMCTRLFLLAACAVSCFPAGFQPADLQKLRSVGTVQFSPDGSR